MTTGATGPAVYYVPETVRFVVPDLVEERVFRVPFDAPSDDAP